MPPRFAYWTILAGGLPTAFRTSTREELLPTFHQLKKKYPDAEMKWFAKGKLWESPEDVQLATNKRSNTTSGTVKGKEWRPGGEHRDPSQRYKEAKTARNQKRRQARWERRAEVDTKSDGKRSGGDRQTLQSDTGRKHGQKSRWVKNRRSASNINQK